MESGAAQERIPTARSLEIPKRWPLVTTLNSRSQYFNKDARLINCYAEKDRATGEYQVEKRPGFGLNPVLNGVAAGFGIASAQVQFAGAGNWLGTGTTVISLSGTTLVATSYSPFGGLVNSAVIQNNISLAGNLARFLFVPDTKDIIFTAGGGYYNQALAPLNSLGYVAYINGYTGPGGAPNYGVLVLTPNDASGWPAGTVPGIVYLDGFAYVMDYLGNIWETTNQNIVSGIGAWSADSIQAAVESDYGVILAKQLIYVVAIKTWSTQFFYDAGNTTGSSLSPVPGAVYNFGCIDADTFADLDGVLFWATQSKVGTNKIVKVKELQVEFISTPAVERALDLANQNASYYATAYQHAGHEWYLITNTFTNVTMVYDIGEKIWYLWTDYAGNYYPVSARCTGPNQLEYHQMIANGNVYLMDGDYVYPNDFGKIVPVDIYTPNFDAGVDRIKTLSQMRINADQVSGSSLWVRFSDDDYGSFNNYRKFDLGRQRPILNDEGSFYRRAYHFRQYGNTKFRVRSADLQMDVGTL